MRPELLGTIVLLTWWVVGLLPKGSIDYETVLFMYPMAHDSYPTKFNRPQKGLRERVNSGAPFSSWVRCMITSPFGPRTLIKGCASHCTTCRVFNE